MGGCGGDGDGSVLEVVLVVVVLAVLGDAVVMDDVVIITMMMSLLTAVRGPSPCAVQSARGAPPGHLQHSATSCPLRRRHTVSHSSTEDAGTAATGQLPKAQRLLAGGSNPRSGASSGAKTKGISF